MIYKPLMPGRHGGKPKKAGELMLVPMIDIFSVLVTFLLMTAVFSRIAIIQLDLPSADAGSPVEPTFRMEVVVTTDGLEVTNGQQRIAALPLVDGNYDLSALSAMALSLKKDHPLVDDASVLMAPDVAYNNLIQVMDAIRSMDARTAAAGGLYASNDGVTPAPVEGMGPQRVPLFTKIAVGDAP
jgi:biopolymer transport protein ExbD